MQGAVRGTDRVVTATATATVALVAERVGDEIGRAEANGSVGVVRRASMARLTERLPPADHVEVMGVGQRSVDIQQRRACHGAIQFRPLAS